MKPDLEAIRKRLEGEFFTEQHWQDIKDLLEWVEKLEAFKKRIYLIKGKTLGPDREYADFGLNLTPDKAWELTLKALAALEEAPDDSQ